MSKKKKSFFINILITTITISLMLLLYAFMVSEIKTLTNKKKKLTEILREKENKVEINLVEIQQLSSEERIVKIASQSLGLICSTNPYDNVIRIDKTQMARIKKIVNDRYE